MTHDTDNYRVKIEYGVIANGNEQAGGFIPMIWVNDLMGDCKFPTTWSPRSLDREQAMHRAEIEASEEAERYCGDYNVTVPARSDDV
jgi:hypothetical protein